VHFSHKIWHLVALWLWVLRLNSFSLGPYIYLCLKKV